MNLTTNDIANKGHYLSFSVSIKTSVPVNRVWEVLSDFGTEHRWTKTLLHCERDSLDVHVGTSRACTLAKPLMGRTEVREELIEFEVGKALAYKLDGGAGPFRTAASRWSTDHAADGRTEITVEGRFTPRNGFVGAFLWPVIKPFITRLTRGVLKELDRYLIVEQPGFQA